MTLPNFLVIGAQKSGTSALYWALAQHPQIYMSRNKEPWFFAYAGEQLAFASPGHAHYEQAITTELATYQNYFDQAGDALWRGEASTAYLMAARAKVAAANIQRFIPSAKLVAILRQPAERAYSAFCHLRTYGFEPERDFRRALAAEASRAAWSPDFHYRANGDYAEALAPYFARFGREQLRIYLYEEWQHAPEATLCDLFAWLGVAPDIQPHMLRRVNESRQVRSRWLETVLAAPFEWEKRQQKRLPAFWRRQLARLIYRLNRTDYPPLASTLRAELTEEYRASILTLQEMLDRDLSHWLVAQPPASRR